MNYKFPLINLITRGHIHVENPTSTVRFLESLSNDSAAVLCEYVFQINDPNKVSVFLDSIQEECQLSKGLLNMPSFDSFSCQRDQFFLKESAQNNGSVDPKEEATKLVRMFKRGVPIAAILVFLAKFDDKTKENIIKNASMISDDAAKLLSKSWATNWILKGGRFAKRAAATVLTAKQHMTGKDISFLKKLGIGAAVAISSIAALILINMIYKRHFSKEAKECSHYQGKERTICMTKARLQAAKEAQKQAEKALQDCDSSNNPEDCRFKMRVEIRSWMKKVRKEEEELKRLTRVKNTAFETKKKPNPFE